LLAPLVQNQLEFIAENTMFKAIAMIGLGAALALPPVTALAEQGASSSYGP
jgi:hypothetical protein